MKLENAELKYIKAKSGNIKARLGNIRLKIVKPQKFCLKANKARHLQLYLFKLYNS